MVMMESEAPSDGAEDVAGLLPLASVTQQPYVSELLSFTLDRLHKVSLRASPILALYFLQI